MFTGVVVTLLMIAAIKHTIEINVCFSTNNFCTKNKNYQKKNGDPEKNPNYKYFGFEPEVWHPWWYITSW